jgi:hypothetical protein
MKKLENFLKGKSETSESCNKFDVSRVAGESLKSDENPPKSKMSESTAEKGFLENVMSGAKKGLERYGLFNKTGQGRLGSRAADRETPLDPRSGQVLHGGDHLSQVNYDYAKNALKKWPEAQDNLLGITMDSSGKITVNLEPKFGPN